MNKFLYDMPSWLIAFCFFFAAAQVSVALDNADRELQQLGHRAEQFSVLLPFVGIAAAMATSSVSIAGGSLRGIGLFRMPWYGLERIWGAISSSPSFADSDLVTTPWLLDWLILAAPKKKTTHAKKRMRMAHKYLRPDCSLKRCELCGRWKRPHTYCLPNCIGKRKSNVAARTE